MNLPVTTDGMVTRLAIARATRAVDVKALAYSVGVPWQDLRDWERGEARVPTDAMFKRLGLALRWKWLDLAGPNMSQEDAYDALVSARNRAVAQ